MSYSLNSLYRMLGISRQAVSQGRRRQALFDQELADLVAQATLIREEHPGCGVEKLYHILQPQHMGRDQFCALFMELGFRVKRVKSYTRTTIPTWFHYPNLIEGMRVDRPYAVVQSDITYFNLGGTFCYIVFIVDVYTREILGYHVDTHMRTLSNVKALRMALKHIPKERLEGMIHHSDRGSQYGSKEYTRLLKEHGILVSMGERAQDNAFAERVNGTIKNEYLHRWHIPDLAALKRQLARAVKNYNCKRPHMAFRNEMSPVAFRENLITLEPQKRPMVIIYAEGNGKSKWGSNPLGFSPEEEPLAPICPIAMN